MPELPEVETTKTSLSTLINTRLKNVHIYQNRLRQIVPDLAPLCGQKLTKITRRAKYLILCFEDERYNLLVHLGMSGSLQQYQNTPKRKHDHIIFEFEHMRLHYHDARRFGMVVWENSAQNYLAHLGVEPLEDEFNGQYLYNVCQNTKRDIKTVIMDGRVVVGVGNIYATECLFLAHIHPKTPAHLLHKKECQNLCAIIKKVLQKAIIQGGTSLKDFVVGAGVAGYFKQELLVYGKKGLPCPVCKSTLADIKILGRTSAFCPKCQPLRTST